METPAAENRQECVFPTEQLSALTFPLGRGQIKVCYDISSKDNNVTLELQY